MSEKLIFVHVPKTGGGSVYARVPELDYNRGHNPDRMVGARQCVAFNRCPYDRALSLFFYFREAPNDFSLPHRWHHNLLHRLFKLVESPSKFWSEMDIGALTHFPQGLNHFRPQAWFSSGARTQLYDFGTFDKSIDQMCADHDLTQVTMPEDKNNHIRKVTNHGEPRDELSPLAAQRIREFYAEDFELRKRCGFPIAEL